MIQKLTDQHQFVYCEGVLGLTGYVPDHIACSYANGDNNFLYYGIAENSLLVIDHSLPFEEGKLNVFETDKVIDGEHQLKLSLTRLGDFPCVGQIVMSVNQYT